MDDLQYYGRLRSLCFNDVVGKAFFCYLKEIDTESFLSSEIPETKNKADIVAELLTPIEKFLKVCFVLRNCSIDMRITDLYNDFKAFDSRNVNISPQKFCSWWES